MYCTSNSQGVALMVIDVMKLADIWNCPKPASRVASCTCMYEVALGTVMLTFGLCMYVANELLRSNSQLCLSYCLPSKAS